MSYENSELLTDAASHEAQDHPTDRDCIKSEYRIQEQRSFHQNLLPSQKAVALMPASKGATPLTVIMKLTHQPPSETSMPT